MTPDRLTMDRVVDDAVEDVVVADGVGDGSLVIGPIDGVVADVPEPNGWVEGGAAEGGSLDAVEDVVGSSGAGPGCVVLGVLREVAVWSLAGRFPGHEG